MDAPASDAPKFRLTSVEDYEPLIGAEAAERLLAKAGAMRDVHIANVNSTYYGGGVAELLSSMTLLMNASGIRCGWRVIEGRPDFFSVTKKMHNALQGGEINLSELKREIYEEVIFENATRMHLDHDVVIVHDPQPLPMIRHYRKKVPWIWRCHVDLTRPDAELWGYLRQFIDRWKDPKGVIEAFRIARKEVDATLVLVGNVATDDPEGQEIFEEVCQSREERIRVLSVQDSALVNALQRRAAVVLQKSLREGFGLTVAEAIRSAYSELRERSGKDEADVAVRSSATAEDLPEASFAGQQETFLNIRGEKALMDACRRCLAPLFTDRTISYRENKGFDHLEIALSVGVQTMVGFRNVVVMIPFCRAVGEADRVLEVMAENGLKRGESGLEVYVMCEVPSNVVLARAFAERFDGFSIGSNDLTRLTLGVDRDSEMLSDLFDEQDEAVKWMIREVIARAHEAGAKVGLCGQAPSDHPAFAEFLVECGIDSVSVSPDSPVSPDSFIPVKRHGAEAEKGK